jgi:hypothetical protein
MNPDELKALQAEMKRLGIYQGIVDGKLGPKTETALETYRKLQAEQNDKANAAAAQERADKLEADRIAIERAKVEQAGKSSAVADAAETAKALRKQRYDDQASSGLGIATETAAGAPAALTGVAAGRGMGMGINKYMDASQASKNAVLQGAATDRVAGLTTREGARLGSQLSGAMPSSYSALRVGGRMAPHLGLGAFMAGKGAYMLNQEGEDDPFYPKMANRAAGLGMLGAGTGIAERGLMYGIAPGVAPDAKSIAVIESNQLRRKGGTAGPAKPSKAALQVEAKAAGITGVSKMNVNQLTSALRKIGKSVPALAFPTAAAALAYSMTSDQAAAADGTTPAVNSKGLTNAGIVGTTAAGTGYGLDKLAKALGTAGRGALSSAGSMMSPMMAPDYYDPTQPEINMDRNVAARYMPSFMRGGGIEDAYQMAQVPEANPMREQRAAPEQSAPAAPNFSSLDDLASAAEQDPELAAIIRELVQARLSGAQSTQ